MKKTALFATLALCASATFAQSSVFARYDYDNVDASRTSSRHEGVVGVAFNTSVGTFDMGLVGRRRVAVSNDDTAGVELGYSRSISVGPATATGRVALGQVYEIDLGADDKHAYYSAEVEATTPAPVLTNAALFVGVRHRGSLNADVNSSNRFSAGVLFGVTKAVDLKVGATYTRQGGREFNGATAAVTYKF